MFDIIITIYDTVISSEAGDKVFEPGIFYFERFRGFFDGLFDTSVARVKKTIKKSEKPREIKNYRRKNFSASLLITVL